MHVAMLGALSHTRGTRTSFLPAWDIAGDADNVIAESAFLATAFVLLDLVCNGLTLSKLSERLGVGIARRIQQK